MKIILNMRFPDNANIDVGSIRFDRYEENIHLLGADVNKLNTVLTRSACIGTYNAETFISNRVTLQSLTIPKGHLSTMPTAIHGRSGIYEKK
jgi:hypothetical protein